MSFDRRDGAEMSRRQLLGSLGGIVAMGAATTRTVAGQESDEQSEQWPQIHYGPGHTGSASEVTPPSGELQTGWRSDPGSSLTAPIVADGKVFVGGDGVYAFDAESGLGEWHFEADGSTGVAYSDGFVYAVSGGALRAIDAETGDSLWSHAVPENFSGASAPTVADGGVFVCWGIDDGDGSQIYRFDPTSGDVVWETDDEEIGLLSQTPLVADGLVVTGSNEGLWAFDAETGERQWHVDHGTDGPPTYADGLVVIHDLDGLVAIDPSIGSVRWERYDFDGRVYTAPAFADGTLYTGSSQLHAIDSTTGETDWTAGISINGCVAVTDESVVVGDYYGDIGIVDRADGTIRQVLSLERVPTQPAMADGRLHVTTRGGVQTLVEQNTAPQAEFEYSPVRPAPGEEVRFDGSFSSDPDGSVADYTWTIDGETLTGTSVTHSFPNAGEYEVELSVTDDEGATGTDTATVTVASPDDGSTGQAFTYSPARPVVGEPVAFEATREGESYAWDFDGDGEYETEGQQASHAFTGPGEHAVSLRISREDTTVTVDRTVAVRDSAPIEVSFVTDSTTVQAEAATTLTAVVTNFDDSHPVTVEIELQNLGGADIQSVSNAERDDDHTLTLSLDAAEQRTVQFALAVDDPGTREIGATASYEYTGGTGGEYGQIEPTTLDVQPAGTATERTTAARTQTPTGEPAASSSDRRESTTHTTPTTHADGPGLGIVSALGGLSIAALRRVRSDREE